MRKLRINQTVLHCSIELDYPTEYEKMKVLFDDPRNWPQMPIIKAIMGNGGHNDDGIEFNGHFGSYLYFTCHTKRQAEKITAAVLRLLAKTKLPSDS